ncbi:hypothetical protein GCM10018963_26850 [Saccharothrix longispora]
MPNQPVSGDNTKPKKTNTRELVEAMVEVAVSEQKEARARLKALGARLAPDERVPMCGGSGYNHDWQVSPEGFALCLGCGAIVGGPKAEDQG